MAGFNLKAYPSAEGTRGTRLIKKADGTVLMGALVKVGAAAGDVKETAASTDVMMGVSLYSESDAFTNEADQYEDNEELVIETLASGMVLNLLNSGTAAIAEGVKVEAAADGKIAAGTTDPVGVTNAAIAGSSRGEVIIQVS